MATVEITCNTKRATERLNQYVTQAREKISELDRLTTQLNEKRRQGLKITKEEIALQKQLQTEITELNTAQTRGVDDLKKAEDVMNNLANSSIKEVKKAIRDMTKEMNGLRDIEGIRRVQKDIDRLKESLEEKLGAVNIDEVLNNLSSTPIEKLEEALKKLDAQERKLSANQTAEADKLHAKRERIQRQLDETRMKTRRLIDVEAVLGNKGAYSVKQLQAAYDQLKQKLSSLNTGQTKEIDKTKKQMAELKGEIDRVTGSVKKQSSAWNTAVKNITAYVGVFGAFNFIKGKLQQVFKANAQLSDSLANVRKVSGLTRQDIDQLYNSISKIDSRNSIETLTNLAYQGGKLGIQEHGGVRALSGFVRSAEQVQMALGEDLGEDALPAMAKLTEVMGLIDSYGVEDAMQKAASSIFNLSTSSTATGRGIVEFSRRLMGLANISRITTPELLALGSASEALGYQPEVASTAFGKLFTSLQRNHNLIEKSLEIPKGTIDELFRAGKTIDAIVLIFDKMHERGNMNALGDIFKDLGSDGQRLVGVMAAMADRVDILKKHLDISNEAFEEGEAVIAEYMIQNQTAAAYMERAANIWEKAFVNPEGIGAVSGLAKQWHELSIELTQNNTFMGSLKLSIEALLSVIKILISILPQLITFLLFKGSLTAVTQLGIKLWDISKAIWASVTASKALTAMQKWNAWMTALALIGTLIMTIVGNLNEADEAAERARKREEELAAAREQSLQAVRDSTRELENYKNALDKSNKSQEERDKLLRSYLKKEYQGYLDYLGIEIDKVENLADAYDQVLKTMKLVKAAEEKENYKKELNRENTKSRIEAQADAIRIAGTYGASIDKKFLEHLVDEENIRADNLYYEVVSKIYGHVGKDTPAYRNFAGKKLPAYNDLATALEKYVNSRNEEYKVNKAVENDFNDEFSDLGLSNFDLQEYRETQLRNRINRQGGLEQEKPDRAAIAAARKAQQDEKQALRKDLQDAKQESDAIIAKIEEWYRLQETVITGMQADGKLTKEQTDQAVRTLNIAKNTALRDARLAISGRDTEAWEVTKKQIGNLMLDQGQWSQELLQQILKVSMDAIRRNLSRIDKGGGKFGITTSSLKDAVDKNAAGNQREVARLMARSQQEVEKIFMEYDFFEQAMRGFSNRLAQMGILSETARQMAERLSDANNPDEMFSMKDYDALLKGNEGAKQQMLQAFIRSGAQPYGVNPEDKEQLRAWFMEFVGKFVENEEAFGGAEYQYQSWAKPFEQDFELWLRDSDKYLSSIQSFYFSLMKSEEDYYEKRKQSYNHYKKQLDQQDMAAGIPTKREDTERKLQTQATLQENGIGASFWRQQGLGGILNDPEVMLIQKRIEWRNQDLASAKALLAGKKELWAKEKAERLDKGEKEADIDADLAQRRMGFEDLIKERQTSLFEQQLNLTTKIAQEMRKRVQTVNNLTKPIQDGALNIGKKFGEMLAGVEEQSMTWKEIWHSMAVAVGESVIDMTAQYAQNLIMEKAMNAQSKQEAISKANTDVAAGIASGSAKTIGTLGWWGIALIPVIAALLKGLLQAAFASNKSSNTANSSSNIKTKLVSGMLTYDEGNVYAGTDGHVYRATAKSSLPAGVSVVRHPIATTVNGHNALVAERGPEIVIGRRATRHIQMNEPGLLRHLATINGRYRTYDQGTVPAGSPDGAPSLSGMAGGEADERLAAALDQNTQIMAAFVQMMNTIQQRGIPAHINKFGPGGLVDEVKSGLKFDARYRR